ncbi:hypothetical protein GPALN_006117 [Globodera pallida]|nr:hypothetical protein GPALN_006117 [Globodera pallida]
MVLKFCALVGKNSVRLHWHLFKQLSETFDHVLSLFYLHPHKPAQEKRLLRLVHRSVSTFLFSLVHISHSQSGMMREENVKGN